jgi:hypothetical protein
MDEHGVRNYVKSDSPNRVESRERKPQNAKESNMGLNPACTRLHERYGSDDLFAALAAIRLTWLHCGTACIAEHEFLPANFPCGPRHFDSQTKDWQQKTDNR